MKTLITLNETKAFWVREGLGQSIIADTYSIFTLGLLFWFNHNFIGGSYFVNFLIFLVIVIKLIARISNQNKLRRFASRKDLIEYLQKLEAEENK